MTSAKIRIKQAYLANKSDDNKFSSQIYQFRVDPTKRATKTKEVSSVFSRFRESGSHPSHNISERARAHKPAGN